jgi:uncharacterized protein YkwD
MMGLSALLGIAAFALSPRSALGSKPQSRTSVELASRLATLASGPARAASVDPALAVVARRHAAEILAAPERATRARIEERLAAEGLADAQVLPFSAVGPGAEGLEEAAERFARREARARGATHVGVGTAEADGRRALVALFSRRLIALAPLPPRVNAVRHTLRGRAPPELEAEVWVLGPCGDVLRCRAPIRRLRARRDEARLWSPLSFPEAGHYRVEVMALGERGPEIAALWAVAVRAPAVRALPPPRLADASALRAAIEALRAEHDLAPLAPDRALDTAAADQARAVCEAQVAAHLLPGRDDPQARALAAGHVGRVAENVAIAATIGEAHRNLVASPSHRNNLLEPFAASLGIGIETRPGAVGVGPSVCVVELFGVAQPPR